MQSVIGGKREATIGFEEMYFYKKFHQTYCGLSNLANFIVRNQRYTIKIKGKKKSKWNDWLS